MGQSENVFALHQIVICVVKEYLKLANIIIKVGSLPSAFQTSRLLSKKPYRKQRSPPKLAVSIRNVGIRHMRQ